MPSCTSDPEALESARLQTKRKKPNVHRYEKHDSKLSKKHPTVSNTTGYWPDYSDEGRQEDAINCSLTPCAGTQKTLMPWPWWEISSPEQKTIFQLQCLITNMPCRKADDHIAMNNIGANLMQLGKGEWRAALFWTGLSINSNYPNTLYGLGMVKGMQGDHSAAVDNAIQTLRNVNQVILYTAMPLSWHSSKFKAVQSIDTAEMFNQYSQQLAIESGKNIDIIRMTPFRHRPRSRCGEL